MKFLVVFFIFLVVFFFPFSSLFSQNEPAGKTMIDYRVETSGSVASQSTTPFWIHNNTEGTVPLDANYALLRGRISGIHSLSKNLRVEAGIDLVGTSKGVTGLNGTNHPSVFLQQLHASVTFRALQLKTGMKEDYHSVLDKSLSSGDFAFSANARPMPEVNLRIPTFVTIPYTKNYLQFKGDFAVGRFIDDAYTLGVKAPTATYAQNVLLHHKSVFFLLKDPAGKIPFRLIFGVEDCAQWGGWNSHEGNLPQSFRDFFRIVTGAGGGEDAPEGEQINRLGNHLGTYTLKADYAFPSMELAIYKQHYFEDNSGMEYANWRDGIWGIECGFFKQSFLEKIVLEYIQTTNQSGPFHFPFHKEFPPEIKFRIGGGDSYYNHGYYRNGWSHFGHAIGNPLLTSPEYNRDGTLGFKNNRIKAVHGGLKGTFSPGFSYRILGTAAYGYGPTGKPFLKRLQGLFGLLECNYIYPKGASWEFGIQIAADKGSFYGDNIGCMLKISKRGIIIK
jgi:hypothetical protein